MFIASIIPAFKSHLSALTVDQGLMTAISSVIDWHVLDQWFQKVAGNCDWSTD
jgi:hypothetical protein